MDKQKDILNADVKTDALSAEDLSAKLKLIDTLTKLKQIASIPHQKVQLVFPDSVSPDLVGQFLMTIDATVITPSNAPDLNKLDGNDAYTFLASKKTLEKFMYKTNFFQDVKDKPDIIRFYKSLMLGKKQIQINFWSAEDSMDLLRAASKSHRVYQHVFKAFDSERDKINFLYSLCSHNVDSNKFSENYLKTEPIFRAYLVNLLHKIESATDPKQKSDFIDKLSYHTLFDATRLNFKVNEFKNNLGVLKGSSPVSLEVVLSDGTRANFFNLEKSKSYKFMHSINVSKINVEADFSKCFINGDFICKKAKAKIKLPNRINGILDCSDFNFIDAITRIPFGATSVDFSNSVKTFAVLEKIVFPKTVSKIYVARSVINNILKNPDAAAEFDSFAKKYPWIQVWDSKQVVLLQDALKVQATQQQEQQKQKVVPVVNVVKPKISEKTDEWLTRKEIIDLLASDDAFCDIADLDRLVKRVTNANSGFTENKLYNAQVILCVNKQYLNEIKTAVLQTIAQDAERIKPKANTVIKPAQNQQPAPVKKQKKQKPLRIEKYISKQMFSSLRNICGDSIQLLYSVLERISMINTDYTMLPSDTSLQNMDKQGNLHPISDTNHKRGKAAAVGIEHSGKRIVLTINPQDKIIVVIACFQDHADNANLEKVYNRTALPNAARGYLMDGATIVTKRLVESNEYLNIKDLMEQYAPKVNTTKATDSVSETQPVKRKRPRINTTRNIAPIATTTDGNVKCSLLDFIALEHKTNAILDKLETEIANLKKEKVPDSMLEKLQRRILDIGQNIK